MGNDDGFMNIPDGIEEISIHVPAWGTTKYDFENDDFEIISIHVPAWGTTKIS